jgi:hypothetical protein
VYEAVFSLHYVHISERPTEYNCCFITKHILRLLKQVSRHPLHFRVCKYKNVNIFDYETLKGTNTLLVKNKFYTQNWYLEICSSQQIHRIGLRINCHKRETLHTQSTGFISDGSWPNISCGPRENFRLSCCSLHVWPSSRTSVNISSTHTSVFMLELQSL